MRVAIVLAAAAGFAGVANAQFLDPNLPGGTDFDGWENLTVTNPQIASANPPFPSFPGSNPWPEAIESDASGSGDANFDKTSGFGYPASVSIYASPFGNGTFQISDSTPIAGLETVLFQIEIGEGSSGFLAGDATLTVNGNTPVALFDSGFVGSSTTDNPFGGGNLNISVFGFQWDLSGLGPITSFDVDFGTAGTSTTIFGLRLDQGDQFTPVVIPAPGAVALLGLGALGTATRRRR